MTWTGAYTTQLGPDGQGHDRCWAACIASALLSFGWQSDPYGLTREVAQRGGGEDQTKDLLGLIETAQAYGLQAEMWVTWPQALTGLEDGAAVLALVDNRLLVPRAYPAGAAWEALHFVRLVQLLDDETMVYAYDPLCYLPQRNGPVYQGPTVYTRESLTNAIMATPLAAAGVLLYPPDAPAPVADLLDAAATATPGAV